MDGEGHVVVSEYSNNRIQVLAKDGKPVLKFGASGPGKLKRPSGRIYHKNMFIVSDSWNHCLKVFDSSTSVRESLHSLIFSFLPLD